MTDDREGPRPRLTMRVYQVDPEGAVTGDTGVREVLDDGALALNDGPKYPPCECASCRRKRAAK